MTLISRQTHINSKNSSLMCKQPRTPENPITIQVEKFGVPGCGSVYLAFLALRDDAQPILVDEQVPVPERPALRPAAAASQTTTTAKTKSISTAARRNASKKERKKKTGRKGRAGGYRNLPMVDSWEGRSSLPGFLIGRGGRSSSA